MLAHNEIHIWLAELDQPMSTYHHLHNLLSIDEIKRAENYYRDREKKQFVLRHGILRNILSLYCDIPPAQIDFCYNYRGKPALREDNNRSNISFNLSFSGRFALFGICRCSPIGVDIEQMKNMADRQSIIERFFSPTDLACYNQLSENYKKEAFFAYWTRKEAFVKAIGDGLHYPLDEFDVAHAPGERAKLIRTMKRINNSSCWVIHDLKIAVGYAAAFAAQKKRWQISLREWTDDCHINLVTMI